jgi:chromosome segregation protein
MLKRLELVGFKSFADKTQFDFPPSLTAIVGPNGSGKSNVVDAVRWVLGEQSAKSLRGGEMADVIFNGSASRRSFGMAEVTMTFDNARRQLATDADEVQITRRVYRNGEGEYLINQQPSRLRDIKQLFLGSGAGVDAYCIIQQGQVDVLLQASTKERRTIFEEAAGISRFKAKKIETLRKLERVDQNLQRLRDIIDEVEKQLRSVKLQASKAQRYQEHTTRLRELRVGLGLQEFCQLASRLQAESAVLEELRVNLEQQAQQAEAWEAETQRLEAALAELDRMVHEQETLLAGARQQIAAEESTLAHEWTLSSDLETDLRQTRSRLSELAFRVAALTASTAQAAAELQGVLTQCEEQRGGAQLLEAELAAVEARLEELHQQAAADKDEHLEQMRQAARLQNDAVSYKAQVDNLRREHERLRLRTEQAAEHLASLDVELQELTAVDEQLQGRLSAARQALTEQRQERDRQRQQQESTQERLADLRAQRSGLASRIEVLEGLERRHEGLGTGVREMFQLLEQSDPGPWQTVRGMVADLLTVPLEHAPLIDLALGERAQSFLVRDAALLDEALRQHRQAFSGRVTFLMLTNGANRDPGNLEAVSAGVVARADQLVSCRHSDLSDLPTQLLRDTLIVQDLAAARAAAGSGWRCVTLQGELLEPDGTLTIGTHHAESGILSRKSELRELRQQRDELDCRLLETEGELTDLRERLAALDCRLGEAQEAIDVLGEQAADLRSRLLQRRQRREGLHEEVSLSRDEISGVVHEIHQLEQAWEQARLQAETAEQRVQELQARMRQADGETREREHERQQRQQHCTAARVALAQVEERLAALQTRQQQLEADLEQRRQERQQGEQHLVAARARLQESQRIMLQASAVLARCYLDKETAENRLAALAGEREQQRQQRQALLAQAQSARGAWRQLQEHAHARELEVNNLRHHRDTLVERLREDYQIEFRLAAESQQPEAVGQDGQVLAIRPMPEEQRPEAEREIVELRRKLDRLGSVNLDALQELEELEQRAASLQTQHDDLTTAQQSLQEIIARINLDSRRLFSETFATVRTHFHELFRKLFGGGQADIVLEDENDILECGIEIVARPPGKELRSISLMSGGEKTLTAVALLLAVFRSKPSPFCILDEVDAALDEANIGRFCAVLREFLDQSQFIIITHSKRTMAAADVLYGITMQESGISKRVAVRFEDWPDDDARPRDSAQQEVA